MRIGKLLLVLVSVIAGFSVSAQRLELLNSTGNSSIRGLSVVDDEVIWVSGSKGMIGRSVDGGKTWEWNQVKGFEKREFRDIEAFDKNTAVILAIAEPGEILRTNDGGKSWTTVFTDSTKGIFLDAFYFLDNGKGIGIGDPIGGQAYMVKTDNAGSSWYRPEFSPALDSGEACFASSGTNIILQKNGSFYFVTGGLSSRLVSNSSATKLPLLQGKESTGANSIAISGDNMVIVGGDFAHDTISSDNCVLVKVGKNPVITKPAIAPHGYRSCVAFINSKELITCGTSGVDYSRDGGKNWELISKEGFHVCQKAKKGKAVFLAGNGKIAKLL